MGNYYELDEDHSFPKLRLKRLSEEQLKVIEGYLAAMGE